ncbi:MAG TPA: hypothetical protein VGG48_01165 [Rhizomicrobium sp.]
MPVSRFLGPFVMALGLLPMIANAEEIYFCHDDNGVPENIHIDTARKQVVFISGRSPQRCGIGLRDGAYLQMFWPIPGEICLFGGTERVHQFVSISNGVVTFGATGANGTQKFTLDEATGVLQYAAGTDECHKAQS